MVISISKQLGLLIFSFLSGLITGIFFDIYRSIRMDKNLSPIIKIVEDILFWCLVAIVIFIFLLYNNCAFIGIYVYLWIAIGLFIYMFFISKYLNPIFVYVVKNISKFFRIVINIVVYPFKILIYKIKSNKMH
ncbi:spore cortex biosynthesis protein YabQ [Clostridium sporogenes]|uniref:spore cortex biosynthesis protein YabQ n=1 Tax=Clostridium sporogenes TaxID=1509 RepID=UPI0013D6E274|nr:spore cortex biosynthesis protein YabQ [Clostridium sporogenes]NFV14367.1 spore cortex biosynthesis protein YabQ [Clostridium sporogenes]